MHQKTEIIGHLGKDPAMKYTPNGKTVTRMSVAANRHWTGADGQKQEETTWFVVEAWGRRAEVCNQYLHKGSKVFVEGRLKPDRNTGRPRVWEGNDGVHRADFELVAQNVIFLDSKGAGGGAEEDDIPY
jgi:single-strand DNA-binding protein